MKTAHKSIKDILVIDDDPDAQNFIQKVLETAGYRYSMAWDLEEGKKCIEEKAPHLILLDFKLGEDSGFGITQYLKENPTYSKIPVIMMSATTSKQLVLKSIEAGITDFISKPLKTPILLQQLKKVLKEHELPVIQLKEPAVIKARSVASIIKINELGLILQSSIKLTEDTPLLIQSDYLKNLGASPCQTKTTGPAKVPNPGVYRNEVAFKGMDEQTAKKIRNIKIT